MRLHSMLHVERIVLPGWLPYAAKITSLLCVEWLVGRILSCRQRNKLKKKKKKKKELNINDYCLYPLSFMRSFREYSICAPFQEQRLLRMVEKFS